METEHSAGSLALDRAREEHCVLGRPVAEVHRNSGVRREKYYETYEIDVFAMQALDERVAGGLSARPPTINLVCMTKVASNRLAVTEIIIDYGASI